MLPTRASFEMPAVSEDAVSKLHRVGHQMRMEALLHLMKLRPCYIHHVYKGSSSGHYETGSDKGPTSGGTRVRIEEATSGRPEGVLR